MKLLTLVILALAQTLAFAAPSGSNEANLIAIGQGISSPTFTSTVNFSNGYTHESPVGTLYQNSLRVTGEYDTSRDDDDNGDRNSGYGAELGYGTGRAGLAGGYYQRDCDECDGRFAGAASVAISEVGIGLRYEENLYTAALLFNPNGKHRFGLIAEVNDDNGPGEKLTSYGAGYSYAASQWTFTVDASKRDYENEASYADRILVTPGISVRADFLQISLNDRITINDREDDTVDEDRTHHDLWFGIGVGGKSWHIAGYGNYFNDVSLALSLFF